jgi:hypothetical protein
MTKGMLTLAKAQADEEILDCRDFIIGGENNGLVVHINGKSYRVPYIYPYCCPYIRASVILPMKFSIEVWKMNRDYYRKNKYCLGNLAQIWQDFFSLAGFYENSKMEDICNWHLEKLEKYY